MNRLRAPVFVFVYGLASHAYGAAFDQLPSKIRVLCESRESGRVEAILTKPPTPVYASHEVSDYSMELKRFDPRSGAQVSMTSYPADPHAKDYAATLWLNHNRFDVVHEPVIHLKAPATGVDWTDPDNRNSCYVTAPLSGLRVSFGVSSGRVQLEGYSEPSCETTEVNPDVDLSIIPGPGFGRGQDVLNGRRCMEQRHYVRNPQVTCTATVIE